MMTVVSFVETINNLRRIEMIKRMKKNKKYEQSVVALADWTVSMVSDENGHLFIYVCHKDGTEIIARKSNNRLDSDVTWAERLTTEKIEKDIRES